jgi:hypothetical protein
MSLIWWNSRGLGSNNPDAIKYLVHTYKPEAIILSEIMTTSNKIEELKYILAFDYCFVVNRIGMGGGLACLWNMNFN